jgi:hypothetical protein
VGGAHTPGLRTVMSTLALEGVAADVEVVGGEMARITAVGDRRQIRARRPL